MTEIGTTPGVSALNGGASPAADGAASLPPAARRPDPASARATTGYSNIPAIPSVDPKVARLAAKGAVPYQVDGRTIPGLAQIPMGAPRVEPRKEPKRGAAPM